MKPFFLLVLLFCHSLVAAEDLWQIHGMEIHSENNQLKVKLQRFEFQPLDIELHEVVYSCHSAFQIYPLHSCSDGSLRFSINEELYQFKLDLHANLPENQIQVELINLNDTLSIKWNSDDGEKFLISTRNMSVEGEAMKSLGFENLSGGVDSDWLLDVTDGIQLQGQFTMNQLSYENEESTLILAELGIQGELNAFEDGNGFLIDSEIKTLSGEALIGDLYLDFSQAGFSINNQSLLDQELNIIKNQTRINLQDDNTLLIKSEGTDILSDLKIEAEIENLDSLYNVYMKSMLDLYGLEELEMQGGVKTSVNITNGNFDSIQTEAKNLYFFAPGKKLELENLNAELHWQAKQHDLPSELSWSKALLAGLPVHQTEFKFVTHADQAHFTQTILLPVFDGSVEINDLLLSEMFSESVSASFYGHISPISLELITRKLDWPVMSGTISGEIPGVVKKGNKLVFDGEMLLNVFDGQMTFSNISTERLFGVAPVISGDVKFIDLSLEKITSTYDFGSITGLVKGEVLDLRITNWKTERLDAFVESYKVKGVKQTISQRALDNISSLGGVQGAISRSFLRFFDSFKYKKLAIGCRLRNSVCAISGVKDVSGGYFLVQGRGIPKINIVGHRKFIDWEIFLDRLLNASF